MVGASSESVYCRDRSRRRVRKRPFGILLGFLGMSLVWIGCPRPAPLQFPSALPSIEVWSQPPGDRAFRELSEAWVDLQTGHVESARDAAIRLQGRYPEWPDPLVLEGFTYYAENRWLPALRTFQRVLKDHPQHLGALYGMMFTYVAQGDELAALQYGEQIRQLRPGDRVLADYVHAIALRAVDQMLDRARDARQQGDIGQAHYWYRQVIARIPENVDVLLEYARWLRELDQIREAMAYYQLAYNQDPENFALLQEYAPLLVEEERCDQARPLLETLIHDEPGNERWRALSQICETQLKRSRYHEEYEKVRQTPAITRGQLATILCLEFPELLEEKEPVRPVILEDVRDHWAAQYIQKVVQLNLIPLYGPHRFDPEQTVNRGEFADVLYRVLRHFGRDAMVLKGGSTPIRDVSPLHRQYRAIVTAVRLGLLKTDKRNRFHADQPVTGADAIRAIQSLRTLVLQSP